MDLFYFGFVGIEINFFKVYIIYVDFLLDFGYYGVCFKIIYLLCNKLRSINFKLK